MLCLGHAVCRDLPSGRSWCARVQRAPRGRDARFRQRSTPSLGRGLDLQGRASALAGGTSLYGRHSPRGHSAPSRHAHVCEPLPGASGGHHDRSPVLRSLADKPALIAGGTYGRKAARSARFRERCAQSAGSLQVPGRSIHRTRPCFRDAALERQGSARDRRRARGADRRRFIGTGASSTPLGALNFKSTEICATVSESPSTNWPNP